MLPDGVRAASVHLRDGRIAGIGAWDDAPAGDETLDVGELVVMAGLVDTHVHVNEPGRTEWEGFATATRAAAAGGVTTLLDMPLNAIPATTSVSALEAKRDAARGQCSVDVGFIGGVVPGNESELTPLRDAGVLAFKCFLAPSGVPEFRAVDEGDLKAAFPILAALGLPLMVHAEDPSRLGAPEHAGVGDYAAYLASRPPAAERAAIETLVRLVAWCPVRVHIVHVASVEALDVIREAQRRGLPVTAETCPHYLIFASEEIPAGATEYKCAPPIRAAVEREALWQGLRDASLSMVVTDHSPAPPAMKQSGGDFLAAWGGIASLQLGLAAVWTGASVRDFGVADVARWMCTAPAALAGLTTRKGRIAEGCDADLVVWDPDASFVVDPARLEHRHPLTPYAGRILRGIVHLTLVRGAMVFDRGTFASPHGALLLPSTSLPDDVA